MSFVNGNIVWYYKIPSDLQITYAGSEPCPATVKNTTGENTANLIIMVDNNTPVERANVPLVAPGDAPPPGHYAKLIRS